MKKPPAGDGHLLGIEDPAQTVGVGDDVGKGVEVNQIAGHQAAEEGGFVGWGQALPQIPASLINKHSIPPRKNGHKKPVHIIGHFSP